MTVPIRVGALRRPLLMLLALVLAALPPRDRVQAQGPSAHTLAVRDGRVVRVFWRGDSAPDRWSGMHPVIDRALHWTHVGPGVDRALLHLAGSGESWRTGVVIVRFDPAVLRPQLAIAARVDGRTRRWSVDRAAPLAAIAFNAGQFIGDRPWGWLVVDGRERQAPGHGPLSTALVWNRSGRVRLVDWDGIASERATGDVFLALQSYPALLVRDGEVPEPLRRPGRGVDLKHNDARLALCELRDGRLLVALTRFEALGGVLSQIPFGPTLPEMAALMGALGCARAVALDGGISGQLAIRSAAGRGMTAHWPGLRSVPAGIEWVREGHFTNRRGP